MCILDCNFLRNNECQVDLECHTELQTGEHVLMMKPPETQCECAGRVRCPKDGKRNQQVVIRQGQMGGGLTSPGGEPQKAMAFGMGV